MQKSSTPDMKPIVEKLRSFRDEGKKVFCTSSFQTQSIVLLHMLADCQLDLPVYFLNTGYHYPETLAHRRQVAELLGLQVTDLHPKVPKSLQKDAEGRPLHQSAPDLCCFLNKVQPLQEILMAYDIWVSGVRRIQTQYRRKMREFEETAFRAVRYHPLLDWTDEMVEAYISRYQLPRHPLASRELLSIGCEPCTRLDGSRLGDNRRARWFGMTKVECGLHTILRGKGSQPPR